MDAQSKQQLFGAVSLVNDAVGAAVNELAIVHQSIEAKPYAMLALSPVAARAAKIEQTQRIITTGVYNAIGAINQIVGAAIRGSGKVVGGERGE